MTRTTTYNATGDATAVTDPASNTSITTTTDTLGRVISTTDATALTTTTAYDDLNRPTTSKQAGTISGAARSFTTTNTYDPTTGQLTAGGDAIAGASTATYSLGGAVIRQSWTGAAGGALSATTLVDTTGTPTSKTWRQGTTVLLSNTVTDDGHDRIVTDTQNMPTLAATVAGSTRTRRYGYDNTGRLTTTADTRQAPGAGGSTTAATQCVIRAWAFNANSNRTGEAASAPTSSACASTGYTVPATTGTGAITHTYNGADQITDTTSGIPTSYDSFGRTTQLSGSTAGAPGTAKLTTVGYTVTDMAAAQTLYTGNTTATGVESSQTWAVDPTGSRFTSTAITTGSATKTTTYRYDDTGDSPALITEADGTTTRPVTDLSGEMTATTAISATGTTAVTWQLTNLHGDTAATLTNTAGAAPAPCAAVDEYGKPLDSPATAPAAGTTPTARYNWLGGHQRSDENITGLTLMGARLYNPTTGRFLSVDPDAGGNANAYTYPVDPINKLDLDGHRSWWKKAASYAKKHWRAAAEIVVGGACIVVTAGACFAAGMAVVGAEAIHDRLGRHLSWRKTLFNAGVGTFVNAASFGLGAAAARGIEGLGGQVSRHGARSLLDRLAGRATHYRRQPWGQYAINAWVGISPDLLAYSSHKD